MKIRSMSFTFHSAAQRRAVTNWLGLALLSMSYLGLPLSADAESIVAPPATGALQTYVNQADPAFEWEIVRRRQNGSGVELIVEFTSQTWRSDGEVDRTKWRHGLKLLVPNDADPQTALLSIGGGVNDGQAPGGSSGEARQVALATSSVVAELTAVPNQPLEIGGDGQPRYEDNLLARSWRKYLETRDPTWIAQLPMTKAAVRAMDVVQEVLATETDLPVAKKLAISRFVVTGASKRGWTTWLTAAVDPRVCAIAPMVIDLLNIRESSRHHRAVYGFWAPALEDYERQGLADRLNDPALDTLLQIIDPYHYRDRLTMPKLVINATGDEFFLPDSSRYYFDDLQGEKHLCYVPNASHGLNRLAVDTLIAFHHCVVNDRERPTVEWTVSGEGKACITCSEKPVLARHLF
ncbi:MAG: PhoPQ-activated protein PqaA family protein, partial [Planctomycetota bacterium]